MKRDTCSQRQLVGFDVIGHNYNSKKGLTDTLTYKKLICPSWFVLLALYTTDISSLLIKCVWNNYCHGERRKNRQRGWLFEGQLFSELQNTIFSLFCFLLLYPQAGACRYKIQTWWASVLGFFKHRIHSYLGGDRKMMKHLLYGIFSVEWATFCVFWYSVMFFVCNCIFITPNCFTNVHVFTEYFETFLNATCSLNSLM